MIDDLFHLPTTAQATNSRHLTKRQPGKSAPITVTEESTLAMAGASRTLHDGLCRADSAGSRGARSERFTLCLSSGDIGIRINDCTLMWLDWGGRGAIELCIAKARCWKMSCNSGNGQLQVGREPRGLPCRGM
jgi:hypothetical protein